MAAILTEVEKGPDSRRDMLTLIGSDLKVQRRLDRRQRQERLCAIGEMTARFAHQVRTPLATVKLCAGQLSPNDASERRALASINARLDDLSHMVNDMLGFAAGAATGSDLINVAEACQSAINAVSPQTAPDITLTLEVIDDSLCVVGNRSALTGAILNLIDNARQALAEAGAIEVSVSSHDQQVHITVADNGCGIEPAALPRLFEPFFTTRSSGTGLGLAVVEAVVEAHAGSIRVDTSDLGTSFTLKLPPAEAVRKVPAND